MGSITPNNNEYNLISSFIEEALDLLGQSCKLYPIKEQSYETSSDSLIEYGEPIITSILFEDDLNQVKLKGKHWDKETDIELLAYVSLNDLFTLSKNCIIEVTPTFYNKDSKFIVTDIFGQVNTTYARVKLVPYRQSLRTDSNISLEDKKDSLIEDDYGILHRKSYLKK